MSTPLQQMISRLVDELLHEEQWATDMVLGDLTDNQVQGALHAALNAAGVDVQMLQVEVCNYPIVAGSMQHHNQPDTRYRMEYFLLVDGQPMGMGGGNDKSKYVAFQDEASAAAVVMALMDSGRADKTAWNTRISRPLGPFYSNPEHRQGMEACLSPRLADYQAQCLQGQTASLRATRPASRL